MKKARVKKNQTHIAVIALFQLLLFIAPQVIKDIHHHHSEIHYFAPAKNKALSPEHDQCPICSFEYATFLSAPIEKQDVFKTLLYVFLCRDNYKVENTAIFNLSYRAPPSVI